jgi:hypothetical protein
MEYKDINKYERDNKDKRAMKTGLTSEKEPKDSGNFLTQHRFVFAGI